MNDLDQIQTVLLDMDGTLLDLHFDNYFWAQHVPEVYSQVHGLSLQAANEILLPLFKAHEGTLNWYCVDFWSDQLGFDVMHYKAQVSHKVAYRPQAEAFLARCRENIADTRLVTNGHRKVLDLKAEITGLDRYFAHMVCSHELGAAKESQEFWHRLQAHTHFEPDLTLFIDDNECVLDSAHHFGIRHVYSVAQPDSVTPRVTKSKYPMLESFPGV